MSKMKRFVSGLLALVLLLSSIAVSAPNADAAEDYRAWAQGDSRWGSIPLGSSDGTMESHGCLVTSIAKLMVQAGFCDANSFNPGTLVTWLNNNGGFRADGGLYYGKPSQYASGFQNQGDIIVGGPYSSVDNNDLLLNYVKQGYHLAIQVKGGGHWVAVDTVKSLTTGTIYIMDTGTNMVNADITLASRYSTFNIVHAYKGGGSTSLNVWWGEYAAKHSIGTTNAVLAQTVYLNVDCSAISEAGIYLYDYSGKQLASKREATNHSGRNQMEMWYDLNGELGYTILPGTPYKYRFVARVNGKDYYSDMYSFTSGGTHTHKYDSGTVTKSPTCTATGTRTYTCTTCGGKKTESIAAKGHSWENATCTAAKTCTVCGTTSGSALGHSFSYKLTKTPTTDAKGTLEGKCSKCSAAMTTTLPKLNTTDYTYAVTKAATCTATGTGRYTWKTTSYGSWYFDVTIFATGHSWKDANCTSPQTCSSCGTTSGSALGHDYSGCTCVKCESVKPGSDASVVGHSFADGVCEKCGISGGNCGADLLWILNADGVLKISGTGAMADYDATQTPWYDKRSWIKTVELSDGITNIGNNTFYDCYNLSNITIPNTVTKIGYDAFDKCIRLSAILIPEGVTQIGYQAFCNCDSLTSVTIPDSVTMIGECVFIYCDNLTTVEVGSGVTDIQKGMFEHCPKLESVTCKGRIESIGDSAFFCCTGLSDVVIPEGVTNIGSYAFAYCSSLTNVVLPNGVVNINEYAFGLCTGLTSVTIPESVTAIGRGVFNECAALENVYYTGTQSRWNAISIGAGNDNLLNATVHCKAALQEQEDGTLLLIDDMETEELILRTKQVLDLNGYVLTVDSLASFGQIIDSAGGGGLIVTNLALMDNDWLPILDNTGCYRFFEYEVKSLGSKAKADGVTFGFALDFADPTAYAVLQQVNDVAIKVTLDWGEDSQEVAFRKSLIVQYAQLQEQHAHLRPCMLLNVTGVDALAKSTVLTVTPSITAISSKIQMIGDPMKYIA